MDGQRRPWEGSLDPGDMGDPGALDPSLFAQYSPPSVPTSGLPQESKLATYMNRTTSTPNRSLNQVMGKLSLEPSPQSMQKVPTINEFIPMSHQPHYYPRNILVESPERASPAVAMAVHLAVPTTSQVHQENVGGTTYFYPTSSSDSLSTSGLNTSASIGPEACLPSALGPPGASPYATQMFASPPPHMATMNMKPVATWQPMPLPSLMPIPISYAQAPPCPCNDPRCPGYISPRYGVPQRFSPMYSPRTEIHARPELNQNPTPDFTESLALSFYQPETIRQEIYERNQSILQQPDHRQFPDLPKNVDMYTELIPLGNPAPHSLASSYRATHRQTGQHYALRRLHSYPNIPAKRLDMWKSLEHSNVSRLHDFFASQAFGDHSIVLVFTYHPGCETLVNKFLSGGAGNSAAETTAFMDPFSSDPDAPRPYTHQKNAMLRAVACGALLPEAVLWSLLVQLSAALRAIHSAGLACRSLDATKVIMNGPRVRIAWGGAADAAQSSSSDVHQAQQDDLTALGRLALALACRTVHIDNLATSMDLVARSYSADFKNVILYLLSNTNRRSLTDLMPMIGARYYTQIEALQRRADAFEDQLASEIDNSRLLRILVKLGVVNERPELNMDGSWSETGDRYLLKLFRDRLFHAVSEDGTPNVDMAHITYALNSLDAGTEEQGILKDQRGRPRSLGQGGVAHPNSALHNRIKGAIAAAINSQVELMSRDEQSVLVVTYSELKHCLESAFDEVMGLGSRT